MYRDPQKISEFILDQVEHHPSDIVSIVADEFGVSRQSAHAYIAKEVVRGLVIKTGRTSLTRYFLAGGKHIDFKLEIKPGLAEDRVWSKYVKPLFLRFSENVVRIVNYGFTEIFNNAIDHSEGTAIFVDIKINDTIATITIMDNGVGIFQKIQNALHLETIREALLHLSKGKFTTDPANHTGEGIFFTSRIFNRFSILSSDMYYVFKDEDWFLSSEKREDFGQGTHIQMSLSLDTKKTVKDVMDQYSNQEIGFSKTIVAVALSADPNDPHVSRSQAKRLLMGLEKFKTIILDFKDVQSVGQAFVDEIFRVFANEHPNIAIHYLNTNIEVESMIKRGLANIN